MAGERLDEALLYSALNVSRDASADEIKRA